MSDFISEKSLIVGLISSSPNIRCAIEDTKVANCVVCFRLVFSKDNTIATTAGAAVRHLVSAVFDRAVTCV